MQSENRGVKRNSAGKLPELINHLIKKHYYKKMAFPRHIISNKKGRKRDETCDYVLRFFNFCYGN